MNKTLKRFRRSSTKKTLFTIVVVLVICVAIGYFWHTKQYDHMTPKDGTTAHTTSTAPSAQHNFKGDKQKEVPITTPSSNASASDQSGSSSNPIPPSSQWSTSKDGSSITVYSPAANSTFTSGESIYGKAISSTISYRLIDNVSGVITSGTVNVVNNNFSIRFSFSTKATRGDIELYNQTSPYGPESNNVLIPVRF